MGESVTFTLPSFFVVIHIVILPLFPLPLPSPPQQHEHTCSVRSWPPPSLATSRPSVRQSVQVVRPAALTRALPVVQFDGKTFLPSSLSPSLPTLLFIPSAALLRSGQCIMQEHASIADHNARRKKLTRPSTVVGAESIVVGGAGRRTENGDEEPFSPTRGTSRPTKVSNGYTKYSNCKLRQTIPKF